MEDREDRRFMVSDGCYRVVIEAQNKEEARAIYEQDFGISYPNNFFICPIQITY